ncbi:MAG: thiamine-phosphate kinase, partial [Terrimicrobiaceae bacterium]
LLMKLSQLSEEKLLDELLRGIRDGKDVVVGPGDDCAAVRVSGSSGLLLLKTDCVVENVHFSSALSGARVGRKALCRALSDIAAMGGLPSHAMITIFSPPEIPVAYWKSVYRGLMAAAKKYHVAIVGGETTSAPVRAISVALTGLVSPRHLVRRSGGRDGDVLYVTGRLGGSLRRKHWAFEPRLNEGRWLADHGFARAMMDLSDGLAKDLPRLAAASGTGFHISPAAIPRSNGVSFEAAVSDGEDYELLFAVRAPDVERLESSWRKQFPKLMLTPIGFLCEKGKAFRFDQSGFDHFRGKESR